jgi:hypothetical protein
MAITEQTNFTLTKKKHKTFELILNHNINDPLAAIHFHIYRYNNKQQLQQQQHQQWYKSWYGLVCTVCQAIGYSRRQI